MCIEYHIQDDVCYVSAQGVDDSTRSMYSIII